MKFCPVQRKEIYKMYDNLGAALNTAPDGQPIVLTLPGAGVFSANSPHAKLIQGICLRMAFENHPGLKNKNLHLPWHDGAVMAGFNLDSTDPTIKIDDIFNRVNQNVIALNEQNKKTPEKPKITELQLKTYLQQKAAQMEEAKIEKGGRFQVPSAPENKWWIGKSKLGNSPYVSILTGTEAIRTILDINSGNLVFLDGHNKKIPTDEALQKLALVGEDIIKATKHSQGPQSNISPTQPISIKPLEKPDPGQKNENYDAFKATLAPDNTGKSESQKPKLTENIAEVEAVKKPSPVKKEISPQESVFLNEPKFMAAALHVHKNFLSTPYQGGSSQYQKSAERAICLLENGEILELHNSNATRYMNLETGEIDTDKIDLDRKSKVVKIIHRPNHDLIHTLRQSACIPILKEFLEKNVPEKQYQALEHKHIERLQTMMLFSVIGRKDETGFSDSPEAKEKYYLEYRKTSAREFLAYAKSRPDLYDMNNPEQKAQLYHDAWMVELMGAPSVPNEQEKTNAPSQYAIIELMKKEKPPIPIPSPSDLFPGVNLNMMNMAHSLDLLRVYGITSKGHDNSKKNIDLLFGKSLTALRNKKDDTGKNSLSKENMISALKDSISVIQFARKMLNESGDKNTTMVEMDEKKIQDFLSSDPVLAILKKIEFSTNANDIMSAKNEINSLVGEAIFKSGHYEYDKKRFDYTHYTVNGSVKETDRDFEKEVSSSMNMLKTIAIPIFSPVALTDSPQVITPLSAAEATEKIAITPPLTIKQGVIPPPSSAKKIEKNLSGTQPQPAQLQPAQPQPKDDALALDIRSFCDKNDNLNALYKDSKNSTAMKSIFKVMGYKNSERSEQLKELKARMQELSTAANSQPTDVSMHIANLEKTINIISSSLQEEKQNGKRKLGKSRLEDVLTNLHQELHSIKIKRVPGTPNEKKPLPHEDATQSENKEKKKPKA